MRGLSTSTYKDRLQVLGLQSLEFKRLQFDIIYTYKILTGKIDINITSIFTLQSYQSTRGHGYKIDLSGCRTNARKFFFAQRVIHPWNIVAVPFQGTRSLRMQICPDFYITPNSIIK